MEGEEEQGQEGQEQAGEEQQQAPPPPQVDPEVEKRARMMGWMPKENFRGDPERWQPAEKFVARAEELMPIMKTQLRKYEDQIGSLRGELESTKKVTERIVKMADKVGQQAYEKAKADLVRQQSEAVAAGDTAKWLQLEQDKDRLERPEKIEIPQESNRPNAESPEFRRWHEENEWYLSDAHMTRYANAYAQENPPPRGVPITQWWDNVRDVVKEAFPHKFTNPARNAPAAVDGGASRGGAGPGRPKQKTYNDLPADAKAVCDKYVSQKLYKSREDYVKAYYSEE